MQRLKLRVALAEPNGISEPAARRKALFLFSLLRLYDVQLQSLGLWMAKMWLLK